MTQNASAGIEATHVDWPLVSVIVPVYNAAPFIAETLTSALSQTYRRREIIIVDDGSTDGTAQQLESYRASVRVIHQANAGQGGARNAGLRVAAGDYIAFLDHDDLWLPETLEVQLAIAARHPESGLIACDGVEFGGDRVLANTLLRGPLAQQVRASSHGEITGRFYGEALAGCPIVCPTQVLIPRHVVDRIGLMLTDPHEPADWDYYVRIARHYPITLHQHSLVRYRYVASSLSGSRERRWATYGLMNLRMLTRHRRLAPAEDRPLLRAALRAAVRDVAQDAYHYGRRCDASFARAYLADLSRLVPREPVVMLWLLALCLPPAVFDSLRLICRARGLRAVWKYLKNA